MLGFEIALVATTTYVLVKRRSIVSEDAVLVVLSAVLPPLFVIVASEVRPLYVTRYLDEAYPAFVLVLAMCAARLSPRMTAAAAAMLVLASIPPIAKAEHSIEDWKGATQLIFARARPGDVVAVYPDFESVSYEYYRKRTARRAVTLVPLGAPSSGRALPSVPAVLTGHRLWFVSATLFDSSPRTLGEDRYVRSFLDARDKQVDQRSFAGDIRVSEYVPR